MAPSDFLIFLAASWLLILTPGPDMLYVLTRGAFQGKIPGLVSAAGVTLGILVHTLSAALGLAVLLKTSNAAFMVVKLAGAAYLVFLGIQTFRRRPDRVALSIQPRTRRSGTIFFQGMLTNVLNPKVALFFLAFLPQFTSEASTLEPGLQMALLGSVYALSTLIFLSALGYFSSRIHTWLQHNTAPGRQINRLTGSLFIGLGLCLALETPS